MFTGIIEEIGKVLTITEKKAVIECKMVLENTKIGDSIAVNGVCLTVTAIDNSSFTADVSPETFMVTALNELKPASSVNLERAMPADGRFGGHIVAGHVDGIGKVGNVSPNNGFFDLSIELNPREARYVVKKGSIAVNGVSLTVANTSGNAIKIAVIPHTFRNTALRSLQTGDYVNIEVDILAKYVEKFLSTSDNKSRIDIDFLKRNGF